MCSPTHFQIMLICFDPPYRTQSDLSYYYYPVCACHKTRVINIFISFHFSCVQMMEPGKLTTYTGHFRRDIPVGLYRITKYIGKIQSNTTCLMFVLLSLSYIIYLNDMFQINYVRTS